MRIALLGFLLAFSLASATAAEGLTRKSWNYEAGFSPQDAGGLSYYSMLDSLQFDGGFQVWFLLGEPVVNCTARWANAQNIMNMEMTAGADDRKILARPEPGEIEVYNVVVVAQAPDPRDRTFGRGTANYIAAICDAGIVAQNGRNGFNVAGSPSWDEFLCAMPSAYSGVFDENRDMSEKDQCKAAGGEWIAAAEAKQIARDGLKFERFEILNAEVSGAELIRRIEKLAWREESAKYKKQRTHAYWSRMNDGTIDGASRQVAFRARLPRLPNENPSTEQLEAYEAAYQAAVAEFGVETAEFKEEWRAKEKELVAKQLEHMRKKADEVAAQEKKLARYRIELENRAANAPEDVDPMGAYRSATLVPFTENYKCGLKRPDGSIAVPALYASSSSYLRLNEDFNVVQCGANLWPNRDTRDEYGIFVMFKGFQKQYPHNGLSYSKNLVKVDLFDGDGKPIIQGVNAGALTTLPRFEEFGLIAFLDDGGYDQELALYSLAERRFVLREHAPSVGYVTRFHSLVEHQGRTAVIIRQRGGDWYCREGDAPGGKGRYFFLDTEQYGGEYCFPDKGVREGDVYRD